MLLSACIVLALLSGFVVFRLLRWSKKRRAEQRARAAVYEPAPDPFPYTFAPRIVRPIPPRTPPRTPQPEPAPALAFKSRSFDEESEWFHSRPRFEPVENYSPPTTFGSSFDSSSSVDVSTPDVSAPDTTPSDFTGGGGGDFGGGGATGDW